MAVFVNDKASAVVHYDYLEIGQVLVGSLLIHFALSFYRCKLFVSPVEVAHFAWNYHDVERAVCST